MNTPTARTVTEPAHETPVVREVDVLVAGGGVSGVMAALAAATEGARVLLIERFGALGGNMGGAGWIIAGGHGADANGKSEVDHSSRIVREFIRRAIEVMDDLPRTHPEVAHAYSYVAHAMAKELGVELMLSAYAADPIMAGNRVSGLFVETKSGRVAVRARIVIDATGDASIASRAGAPMTPAEGPDDAPGPNMRPWTLYPHKRVRNEGGLLFLMAGVDLAKFSELIVRKGRADPMLSAADDAWWNARKHLAYNDFPVWGHGPMVTLLREAEESGQFDVTREIRPALAVELYNTFRQIADNVVSGLAHVYGDYDPASWEDVSLVETELRAYIYDAVRFFRHHVRGFEKASLLAISPFLGGRGGPHIAGEYLLTPQEAYDGLEHPDSIFRADLYKQGHDVPYGMLLPRQLDGILVAGRGGSWLRRGHDPDFRARGIMMKFGEAAGVAAAMAARQGIQPRQLDVSTLRRRLDACGFLMGNPQRRKQLGLAGTCACPSM